MIKTSDFYVVVALGGNPDSSCCQKVPLAIAKTIGLAKELAENLTPDTKVIWKDSVSKIYSFGENERGKKILYVCVLPCYEEETQGANQESVSTQSCYAT